MKHISLLILPRETLEDSIKSDLATVGLLILGAILTTIMKSIIFTSIILTMIMILVVGKVRKENHRRFETPAEAIKYLEQFTDDSPPPDESSIQL